MDKRNMFLAIIAIFIVQGFIIGNGIFYGLQDRVWMACFSFFMAGAGITINIGNLIRIRKWQ